MMANLQVASAHMTTVMGITASQKALSAGTLSQFWGAAVTAPQTPQLIKQQNWILCQFWRLQVWDQGASGAESF